MRLQLAQHLLCEACNAMHILLIWRLWIRMDAAPIFTNSMYLLPERQDTAVLGMRVECDVALFAGMAAQNAPMYPCMSCQIVPASSARSPASSASGPASAFTRPGMRGPASSARGPESASSACGPACAARHLAHAARHPARADVCEWVSVCVCYWLSAWAQCASQAGL